MSFPRTQESRGGEMGILSAKRLAGDALWSVEIWRLITHKLSLVGGTRAMWIASIPYHQKSSFDGGAG